MKKLDIPKTTFRTRNRHHDFIVIPFKITSTSATFMNSMNRVFASFLDKFVVVFMMIFVLFHDQKDHAKYLRIIL